MPNFVNYDGIELTKLFLFGTADVSNNFNERVRDTDAPTPTITYNADEFLDTGGGRFAWAARANIVEFFFTQYPDLPTDKTFSLTELISELKTNHGYSPRDGDQSIPLNQYATNGESADYAERAYMFGSGQATLADATFVIDADGTRRIENILIQPDADNFDFRSDNGFVQFVNDTVLNPTLNPSSLAEQEVIIEWTEASVRTYPGSSGDSTTYTRAQYELEKLLQASIIDSSLEGLLLGALAPNDSLGYIGEYLQSDPILNYEEIGFWGELKSVYYIGNDDEDQLIVEQGANTILVGNTLDNLFTISGFASAGVEVYAGDGDDTVTVGVIGAHFFDGYVGADKVDYFRVGDVGGIGVSVEKVDIGLLVSQEMAPDLADIVVRFEEIGLTRFDDTFLISGDFPTSTNGSSLVEIAAQDSEFEEVGDIIAFDIGQGVNVDLGSGTASVGTDTISIIDFENVTGSAQDDTITGDNAESGNVLIGGGGEDTLSGMGGDDIILGGSDNDIIDGGTGDDFISGGKGADTIDGGAGWDVLTYSNLNPGAGGASDASIGVLGVTVDLFDPSNNTDASIENIEVFVGSANDDHFKGSAEGGEWFAGGEGDDTFTISRFAGDGGPTVIWGGGGQDTIRITTEGYTTVDDFYDLHNTELGILMVNAPGITEENFHTLNLADLGLNEGFVYHNIDVILINHEEQDTVLESRYGNFPEQEIATVGITEVISPFVQSLEGFDSSITLIDRRGFGTQAFEGPDSGSGNYKSIKTTAAAYHTLDVDGDVITVFGGAADVGFRFGGQPDNSDAFHENTLLRSWSTEVEAFYAGMPMPYWDEQYIELRNNQNPIDYNFSSSTFSLLFDSLDEYPTITNIADFGGDRSSSTGSLYYNDSWFIVGGSANESGITTSGAPETYTLRPESNDVANRLDNLLDQNGASSATVGGTSGNDFINPSYQGPNGGSIGSGGQIIPTYAGEDYVEAGEGNDQIYAGDDDDTVLGGGGSDLIVGGTGNDTLTGGTGADTFQFTDGDGADTIVDFEVGKDIIFVNGLVINDLSVLPANVSGTTMGSAVVLTYGTGDQITVNPVAPINSAPVATDDTANVDQDTTVLIDVLSNDSDPDGNALVITSVTASANGSAVIEDGAIRYTPNTGFSGSDTITYTVSDGAGGTATASVVVDVAEAAPDGSPIVVDDYVTVVSGGTILIDALANDSDPDGDGIYIANVAPTIARSLQFVDGQILYEALDNYTGVVEMVYTVSDFGGATSTGSVFIDVVAANSGPIANDDTASVDENGSVLIDVLSNDDAGGGILTITSVTPSANGSAVIEDGAIRYVPNAGFSGPDTISYEVSDGADGTATASVQVEVAVVQAGAPIVVDDFVTVVSGGTILIDAIANDSDPDGDGIYISNVAPTIAQSLQFVNGMIQYEALDNYIGVVEMVYTVSDFGGTTSTGSVFIDVVAPTAAASQASQMLMQDVAPDAVGDTTTGPSGEAIMVDVEASDASLGVASFVTASFAGSSTETPMMSGDSIKRPSDASIAPGMDDGPHDNTDSFVFARDLFKETVNSYRSSGCFDAIDVGAEGLLAAISEGQDDDRGSWMSGGCSKSNRLAEACDGGLRDAFDENAGSAIERVTVDVFEWLM